MVPHCWKWLTKSRALIYHYIIKFQYFVREYSVVIAIIAILASMLLPALGRARAAARAVSCRNNFGSVCKAIFMYSNDNDDWLMPAANNLTGASGGGRRTWWNGQDGLLSDYIGIKGETTYPVGGTMKSGNKVLRSPLVCPSRVQELVSISDSGAGRGHSIGINGSAIGEPTTAAEGRTGKYTKLVQVRSPSMCSYLSECLPTSTYVSYSNESGTTSLTMRMVFPHGGGNAVKDTESFIATGPGTASFSFLDGHADQLDRNKVPRIGANGYTEDTAAACSLWNYYSRDATTDWYK